MMYYMNWVLTNAQIELITADVSVVDYDYGKKKKKSEYDDTPADSKDVKEANERWLDKYGNNKNAGTGLSIGDVLGGNVKADVGVKLD